MKKLTAGIFAGILTIVTVNAARADIATTNYVNQNVDAKVGALSGLETSATNNTVAAINEVNKAAKDASTAATTAETNAKTYADGLNTAMNTRVTATESAITVLNGDATVEGSVAQQITEATMDAISDLNAAKTDIETLKGNAEKVGSVDNKIKTAIDGLDSSVAPVANQIVKSVTQADGKITPVYGAVVESELDAALAKKINDKLDASTTTVSATGTYVKTANNVGANLDALDSQVKTNADAIAGLTTGANSVENQIDEKLGDLGEGNTTVGAALDKKLDKSDANVTGAHNYITAGTGVAANLTALDTQVKVNAGAISSANTKITANETAIADITKANGAIDTKIAAAKTEIKNTTDGLNTRVTAAEGEIDTLQSGLTAAETNITNITKTGGTIDAKITAAQQTLQGNIDGKANVNKDLANKLLTTDATSGQLVSATATVAKPAKCTAQGAQCMLIDKGTGLEWELIVDTYAAN